MIDSLSEVLDQEDFEFIIDKAISRALTESIDAGKIEEIIDKIPFLRNAKQAITAKIHSVIFDLIVSGVKDTAVRGIAKNIDLREFVIKKAQEVSDEEVEKIFKKFAKKELRFIEISGAVLGFIIGLVQSAIIYFLM